MKLIQIGILFLFIIIIVNIFAIHINIKMPSLEPFNCNIPCDMACERIGQDKNTYNQDNPKAMCINNDNGYLMPLKCVYYNNRCNPQK